MQRACVCQWIWHSCSRGWTSVATARLTKWYRSQSSRAHVRKWVEYWTNWVYKFLYNFEIFYFNEEMKRSSLPRNNIPGKVGVRDYNYTSYTKNINKIITYVKNSITRRPIRSLWCNAKQFSLGHEYILATLFVHVLKKLSTVCFW